MDTQLKIYRLVPQAPPSDPNWQNAIFQGEVRVCAVSPGDARLVAAEAEGDFPQRDAKPAEGVSTINGSAFLNEKLFTVILEDGEADVGRRVRGVVSGTIDVIT
ncbi:hypothetical protein [Ciceribacter sp. L1K22]|uniref:hypothetical protein n=1 Tax=Ciceribacter sp. L1K22 TaxID=2820275 RepID=UPI001ABE039B|nr:hypothetical protein [Ciceribacter sp. L1K22]MBO3761411.1 hypothetical protein [Ciceribacter sp. L1K22]